MSGKIKRYMIYLKNGSSIQVEGTTLDNACKKAGFSTDTVKSIVHDHEFHNLIGNRFIWSHKTNTWVLKTSLISVKMFRFHWVDGTTAVSSAEDIIPAYVDAGYSLDKMSELFDFYECKNEKEIRWIWNTQTNHWTAITYHRPPFVSVAIA